MLQIPSYPRNVIVYIKIFVKILMARELFFLSSKLIEKKWRFQEMYSCYRICLAYAVNRVDP